MVLLLGAAALVVGAVASLSLGNWWILVGVMVIHLGASAVVIGYSYKRAGEDYDKPGPVREAQIDEERAVEPRSRIARRGREARRRGGQEVHGK
jgi:membrane protein implicated in regulation of membrane protease activity